MLKLENQPRFDQGSSCITHARVQEGSFVVMTSQPQQLHRHQSDGTEDGNAALSAEEQYDTVGPLCTCGQFSTAASVMDGGEIQPSAKGGTKKKGATWLESSFVHLMTPRGSRRGDSNAPQQQQQKNPSHGLLEQHQLLLQLLDAAHACEGVELCVDCIDRVAAALEADTQRLYAEVEVYHETVQASQQRARTLQTAAAVQHQHQHHLNVHGTEEAYHQEILMLQREVQVKEEELSHLKDLYFEQMDIAKHLDLVEEALQLEQNTLELELQAFDNRRQVLTNTLTEIQLEVDKLCLVPLPKALFDLQVDPRGLRYPLINQLRLAFRPKGDVPAQEIQVAWSQATQLLLILGTLLEYSSLDWKLVPLSDCSKLIYRKEIFNLSPGDCRSLMAWNALLDQVVKHALTTAMTPSMSGGTTQTNSSSTNLRSYGGRSNNHSQHIYQYHSRKPSTSQDTESSRTSSPPFASSPTSIADTELARLDRMDHVGWSQVIHRMASNLLWLSDRASELAAVQVSSMAQCVV